MNTLTTTEGAAPGSTIPRLTTLLHRVHSAMGHLPNTLLAFVARFSIAAVFWKSGQTKIEGLAIDIVSGEFTLGIPRLSDNAVFLFKEEYQLPLLPPDLGATLAALGEHILPLFILLGLATRLSALGLLGMTLVIQLFVYPDAYATHGTWAAVLLYLMAHGPGQLSIDAWIAKRHPV
ncbi:DoxX family protein [Hydrogenophaga aromaticivorans]|nr:DoxX family protein [Hydrogenophaga aromaticivorans]